MDIFLFGAGASAPLGLPVTKGFLKDFYGAKVESFNVLLQYFKVKNPEDLDIEQVFDTLNEIVNIKNSLIYHVFSENRTWNVNNLFSYKENIKNIVGSISSSYSHLFRDIKAYILRQLTFLNTEKAFNFYWSIFKDYPFKEQPLQIFTTNYDLIIEEAFCGKYGEILDKWKNLGIKKLYLGFEFKGRATVFDFNVKDMNKPGVVSLIKLHGSIDWRPYEDIIVLGGKDLPDNPDTPFLIYPGYKGVPDREPFSSLHFAFLNSLTKAERLISVGFAFRDLYINSILHHALYVNDNLKVFAVAPEIPKDSGLPELLKKFPNRVFHIRQKLQLQDDVVKPNLFELLDKAQEQPESLSAESREPQKA